MLYEKLQLEGLGERDRLIAISRYLKKIEKGEIHKLKLHEREFICSSLPHIVNDERVPVYDIFTLEFCSECLLKRLYLTYYNNLDFLPPVYIGHRNLTPDEIARDKTKFFQLMIGWEERLGTSPGDAILEEVKIIYNRKRKFLAGNWTSGLYGRRLYDRKLLEQQAGCFYMYFVTKAFFNGIASKEIRFNRWFVIDYYSYVHIISRHYVPHINNLEYDNTFNKPLSFIDTFNLPYSIQSLITDYFQHTPPGYSTFREYMIFSEGADSYIIWWKRLVGSDGSEYHQVRTMYRIESTGDFEKINHDCAIQVGSVLYYY